MKLYITTDILKHHLENNTFGDTFFVLMSKNISIYLDNENFILNNYTKLKDYFSSINNTDAVFWLDKWITKGINNDIFEKHSLNQSISCEYIHSVEYIKERFQRNIITLNDSNYINQRNHIVSNNINILDNYIVNNTYCENINSVTYHQHTAFVLFDDDIFKKLVNAINNMLVRKHTNILEDNHNGLLRILMSNLGYEVLDQTQGGRSNTGDSIGELDILIRNDEGNPKSIIEAFRLKKTTPGNNVIDTHINKLINYYDTSGLFRNYILVYFEGKDNEENNFEEDWIRYKEYINNLNQKNNFDETKSPLDQFSDYSEDVLYEYSNIKIGIAKHIKNNVKTHEVIHIYINMLDL